MKRMLYEKYNARNENEIKIAKEIEALANLFILTAFDGIEGGLKVAGRINRIFLI